MMDKRDKKGGREKPSEQYKNLMNKLRSEKSFKNIKIEEFSLSDGPYFAKSIANDFEMTMHQLRRFFDEIKKVKVMVKMGKKVNFKNALAFLYPLASYSQARKHCSQEFTKFIELAVQKIQDEDDFETFEKFMMAIVAFSRK